MPLLLCVMIQVLGDWLIRLPKKSRDDGFRVLCYTLFRRF